MFKVKINKKVLILWLCVHVSLASALTLQDLKSVCGRKYTAIHERCVTLSAQTLQGLRANPTTDFLFNIAGPVAALFAAGIGVKKVIHYAKSDPAPYAYLILTLLGTKKTWDYACRFLGRGKDSTRIGEQIQALSSLRINGDRQGPDDYDVSLLDEVEVMESIDRDVIGDPVSSIPSVRQVDAPTQAIPVCCVCFNTAHELSDHVYLDFIPCYREEEGESILNHQNDFLCSSCWAHLTTNNCPLCRRRLVSE